MRRGLCTGRYSGVPLFRVKHRMNQTCSAMGRVQLRHYLARMAEIQRAMNRFWDALEGVPGIHPHRPPSGSGSTMGGVVRRQGIVSGGGIGRTSLRALLRSGSRGRGNHGESRRQLSPSPSSRFPYGGSVSNGTSHDGRVRTAGCPSRSWLNSRFRTDSRNLLLHSLVQEGRAG